MILTNDDRLETEDGMPVIDVRPEELLNGSVRVVRHANREFDLVIPKRYRETTITSRGVTFKLRTPPGSMYTYIDDTPAVIVQPGQTYYVHPSGRNIVFVEEEFRRNAHRVGDYLVWEFSNNKTRWEEGTFYLAMLEPLPPVRRTTRKIPYWAVAVAVIGGGALLLLGISVVALACRGDDNTTTG